MGVDKGQLQNFPHIVFAKAWKNSLELLFSKVNDYYLKQLSDILLVG